MHGWMSINACMGAWVEGTAACTRHPPEYEDVFIIGDLHASTIAEKAFQTSVCRAIKIRLTVPCFLMSRYVIQTHANSEQSKLEVQFPVS
jgi:hypothetical protein